MIYAGKKYKVSRKDKGEFIGRIVYVGIKVIFVEVVGGFLSGKMLVGDHVRITLMATKFKLIED